MILKNKRLGSTCIFISGNSEEEKEKCILQDIRQLQISLKGNENLTQIFGIWKAENQINVIMSFEVLMIEGEIIDNLLAYLIYLRRKCEIRNYQILRKV